MDAVAAALQAQGALVVPPHAPSTEDRGAEVLEEVQGGSAEGTAKSPILIKEFDAISCVHFSPAAPHDFVVTSSTRAQVYSSQTHSVKKTISRFQDVVLSAAFRDDGKLLVAGDATGLVQVFDLSSRAAARARLQVETARRPSRQNCASETFYPPMLRVDYVRAGMVSPENPSLVLSGSYDHTLKLWDLRSSSSSAAITMRHTAPVESVLFFPSGSLCAAAGGPNVKIFDLLSGGKQLYSLSNHQKTVTSLCLDGAGSRLLTGSLDHHVKVFNVSDYSVVHSVKYPAPVLRVALSVRDLLALSFHRVSRMWMSDFLTFVHVGHTCFFRAAR
ncbi:MAG: WD40-repeat-containing domain protein [Olpidium bornovanus]|uniref:WD40-repeat-containing domain protein n=1 Tax=Olpidium bornovanus TaxID=278681 RepID=A0A8H8A266_9FUNG|nr:MAG: WD40-repeat-containing domain protein [Olpidium bornovanus]